jgi:hypothetical protein
MSLEYIYIARLCTTCFTSQHMIHDRESGTPNGAQSSHNSKDRKNNYPIILELIIMMTYLKSTLDKVHMQWIP